MIRLAGFVLFLACASAQAALVTLTGNDVKFTFDDSTMFGSGFTVGNSIFFMPTGFIAQSVNTDGLVTSADNLSITVEMLGPGTAMTQFALTERGDYRLDGSSTSVSATGTYGVNSNTSTFSNSNPVSAGPLTVQGALTQWQINSMISLAGTAGWGQDTAVTIMLNNILTAQSTVLGEQALIQKKFGAFGVQITVVPVPAAFWLFGSALALLGWKTRRH